VIRVYAALLLIGAIHHERRASTARLSLQVPQVLPVRAKVGGSISDPQSVQSGVVVSVVCCLSIQAIEVLLDEIFIGKVSRFGLKLSGISVLEPQRLIGLGVGVDLVRPSVAMRYDCETLGWGGKCHRHIYVLSWLVGEN
jgi:hypothetical protein